MFNAQVVQGISFDHLICDNVLCLTFTLSRGMSLIEGRMKASD